MKNVLFAGLLLAAACSSKAPVPEKKAGGYPDPARYEKTIAGFEQADSAAMPPEGAILCTGSSSMRGWHPYIVEDLAPLTVIPRGFGGSNYNDVLHYFDRVVLPCKPRAILLYEGDNDAALHIPVDTVMSRFNAIVAKTHAALPEARMYVISAKPSIRRWNIWPAMQAINARVQAVCAADPLLEYIDVSAVMLGADGTPKPEIFKEDKLHMVRAGYDLWREAVKPVLFKSELQYERK